ncbi:ABC transporter substrate-binding protein [Parafrankia sp. FMc2]|uniref:ABC transporter substrate-binding protein n=1 Tax=Parafrankia sp. FMc2 TaxID=3233196 RepID=UPI0034D58889
MRARLVALSATLLLTPALLAACGDDGTSSSPQAGADADARGCVTDFDPAADYFPDRSTLEHAKNFTVRYEKAYQVLTVKEPYPDGKPESYVLYRCGTPEPELTGELAGAPRIEIPVRGLYSGSTTHLPLLVDLGRENVLTGVASAATVVDKDIRARADADEIVEYAPGGQIDTERVVTAAPDIVMTGGTESAEYGTLRDAGIPVVANAEWLEADPLGRAEWVKFMAALTGDEAEAAKVFDRIEADYTAIADRVPGGDPVSTLIGTMYQGTWYMPSGGSYVGKLLADAGATYPWAGETDTGSLELDFETVFTESGSAPVWLADGEWENLADVTTEDERYGQLAAVHGGQVWSNTLVIGPGGGNDYWERGVTRPDLVLGDLAAILHPDAFPDHTFAFYRRIT